MTWPTKLMVRPSDVDFKRNGRLYPSELRNVEFFGGSGPDGRIVGKLHPTTTRAWFWLVVICLNETGHKLTVTSVHDAYRTYEIQEITFRNRYRSPWNALCTLKTKIWNGVKWYQRLGVAMAATPGTSNHGMGLALDVAIWAPNVLGTWKSQSISGNQLLFAWLQLNAPTFGFYWNVSSEAWHLEYCAGDETPQRVLDIEAFCGGGTPGV